MSADGPMSMELIDGMAADEPAVKPEPATAAVAATDAAELESRAEGEPLAEEEGTGDADEGAEDEPEGDEGADDADHPDTAERRAKEQKNQKALRRNYRTMEETINKPEYAALAASNPKILRNTILKTNQWHSSISNKDVSTSVLDAKVLTTTSKFGVMQARALQQTVRINWTEVEEKIVERFPLQARKQIKARNKGRAGAAAAAAGSDDEAVDLEDSRPSIDWHKKGILGIQFVAKAKKARAAKKADDDDERAPRTGATHQTDPSKEASTMTDMRVASLLQALPTEDNALCFFDVLFHPSSFTQTVENLFDLTFLVRKGQAVIQIDPELGVPYLWKVADTDAAARANEDEEDDDAAAAGGGRSHNNNNRGGAAVQSTNFQCIFAIDEAKYKEIIEAYGINKRSKPFLADRAHEYAKIRKRNAASAAGGSGSKRKQPAAAAAAAASSDAAAAASSSPARAAPASASASGRARASRAIAPMFSPSQPTLGFFTNAHEVDEEGEEEGDRDEDDYTPSSTPRAAAAATSRAAGGSASKRQRRSADDDNDNNADLSEGEVDADEEAAMSQPAHKTAHKKR